MTAAKTEVHKRWSDVVSYLSNGSLHVGESLSLSLPTLLIQCQVLHWHWETYVNIARAREVDNKQKCFLQSSGTLIAARLIQGEFCIPSPLIVIILLILNITCSLASTWSRVAESRALTLACSSSIVSWRTEREHSVTGLTVIDDQGRVTVLSDIVDHAKPKMFYEQNWID